MWAPRRAAANPSTLPLMNAVAQGRGHVDDAEMEADLPTLHPAPKKPNVIAAKPATRTRAQASPSVKDAPGPRRYQAVQMEAVRASAKDPRIDAPPSSGRMFDEHDFLDADSSLALDLDALPKGHVQFETMAGPLSRPSTARQPAQAPASSPRPSSSKVKRVVEPVVHFTPQPMQAPELPGHASGALEDQGTPFELAGEEPPPLSSPSPASQNEHSLVRRISSTTTAAVSSDGLSFDDEPPASSRSGRAVGMSPLVAAANVDPKRPGIFAFAGFGLPPSSWKDLPGYAIHVLARRRALRRDLETARRYRASDVDLYEAALHSADLDAFRRGLALIIAVVGFALAAAALAISAIL